MKPFNIPVRPEYSPGLQRQIALLNKKLGDFVHAPTDTKSILRMEPFAQDPELMRVAADALGAYRTIPVTAEELELHRITGCSYSYDIVGYWYLAATLALSPEACAAERLMQTARYLIDNGPGDLNILRRIVRLLPDKEHLQPLRALLDDYYGRLCPTLAAYRWLDEAGIPYPTGEKWGITMKFTSDGEYFPPRELTPEAGKRYFTLYVELHEPQSLYGDFRGHKSYEIQLKNIDNSTHGWWDEHSHHLIRNGEYVIQDEEFTPCRLPELFARLDGLHIRLVRRPAWVHATKGIRRAAVGKWLKARLEKA